VVIPFQEDIAMKSALELAMEKTADIGKEAREELEKLTPQQREKVEEVKKIYEGKIAEKDVLLQEELLKMTGGAPPEAVEAHLPPDAREALNAARQRFREEREVLEAERDQKIEDIKKRP